MAKKDTDNEQEFTSAFDKVRTIPGLRWDFTKGLFWVRPLSYPSLDKKSRKYIKNVLKLSIPKADSGNSSIGHGYLSLKKQLEKFFENEDCPVHSFQELALAAAQYDVKTTENKGIDDAGDTHFEDASVLYTLENIIKEGCFHGRDAVKKMLNRLQTKNNLILQGPPGTGKTWLAKRLAYALVGQKDNTYIRSVQFHPNMSYEDFVRGWRPSGDGKLALVDGPLMEMISSAKNDPTPHVLVIEEINRGNPVQIFGEMLTLIENTKRSEEDSLELSYRREAGERVFLPKNLYLIGTMNIADRSLALVDLALRRRFAFIDLEPAFGEQWRLWCGQYGIDTGVLEDIESRIVRLNSEISEKLGPQFQIGHSFFTPTGDSPIEDASVWFREIVETEIGPLLEEYWFDSRDDAQKKKETLLADF